MCDFICSLQIEKKSKIYIYIFGTDSRQWEKWEKARKIKSKKLIVKFLKSTFA